MVYMLVVKNDPIQPSSTTKGQDVVSPALPVAWVPISEKCQDGLEEWCGFFLFQHYYNERVTSVAFEMNQDLGALLNLSEP